MGRNKRVAIIGTNGVPPNYGGFETLAYHLTLKLNEKLDFTVYCSKHKYTLEERNKTYDCARRVFVPLKANGYQSLFYDLYSFLHAGFNNDIILLLGPTPSGVIVLLRYFFNVKVVANHGGLNEWKREKYSKFQRVWARINHSVAARFANLNITDNKILCQSLLEHFGAESEVLRYGGDHVSTSLDKNDFLKEYTFLTKDYDLSVSRAQIDNNLHLLLEAYTRMKERVLVLVSNWDVSDYGKNLYRKYGGKHPNIFLLNAIYDQDKLNLLRANSFFYIHSHSFCGTAPSLVEAMNFGIPIVCFDVPTNRETTQGESLYFRDAGELVEVMNSISEKDRLRIGRDMHNIAKKEYTWENVSSKYYDLMDNL